MICEKTRVKIEVWWYLQIWIPARDAISETQAKSKNLSHLTYPLFEKAEYLGVNKHLFSQS